jgi:hypothetical protein
MTNSAKELCDLCKQHGREGRKERPHVNLVQTGSEEMNARGKDASERYFTCKDCGHEWTWEPGTYGMGWI